MMMDISIIQTVETLFFGHVDGVLRQWIYVTIENASAEATTAVTVIRAGGESVSTILELAPGTHEYRVYAPVLWPEHPPEQAAALWLQVRDKTIEAGVPVGHHRPWTVYLLADVCTDCTWVYADFEAMTKDDADLTRVELNLAEAARDGPPGNRNAYNLVHAREVEYFLEHYPEREERLFEAMRRGEIMLNPFYNMALTGDQSLEEQIRQFYPARSWARRYGLDMDCANHQETPAIAWDMAAVLAGSGVAHLVKAIYPYECPWAARLQEPPVFAWEGPDGSQVLVRRRNTDYVEGSFILRGLDETTRALQEKVIPSYEALGNRYPFGSISLLGCYGDLVPAGSAHPSGSGLLEKGYVPQCHELAPVKVQTVAAYNAQGWEYPRLVNATHGQFWEAVEAEIAQRDIQLEVARGDTGSGWEAWPACLAADAAGWRRAQERAAAADKVAAVLSRLDGGWFSDHAARLAEGWQNLIYLADHAWNGANDANRELNRRLRHEWQTASNQAFDEVIAEGLDALGRRIPTGSLHLPTSSPRMGEGEKKDRRWVAVFNLLGWERSGLVRLEGASAGSVCDLLSGERLAVQAIYEDGKPASYFVAPGVPSVGYRVFELEGEPPPETAHSQITMTNMPQAESTESKENARHFACTARGERLESPYYTVQVSRETGGIVSIFDKRRGSELVDSGSPYHLNQLLYWSEGEEHTSTQAWIEEAVSSPVFAQMTVRSRMKNTELRSTYCLYADLERIDITNQLEKEPTREKQELDFVFPFNVEHGNWRVEAPGAVLAPGADQLPGSGQAVTAVRHFVDLSNAQHGVTLSMADSFIVEFGHRTTLEDPLTPDLSNGTLYALAMENCLDHNEAILDQGGERHFTFRYSLRGHSGGFDPVQAVQFGWEDNNELIPVPLAEGQRGDLPEAAHAFFRVQPEEAILTYVKVGEEGGITLRLWECAGKPVTARVEVEGLGKLEQAWQADLLERHQETLEIKDKRVEVLVRGRGIATAKLELEG